MKTGSGVTGARSVISGFICWRKIKLDGKILQTAPFLKTSASGRVVEMTK
jgi:hypothetical protein